MRLRLAFLLLLCVGLLDAATLADAWRTPCLTAEQRNEVPAPTTPAEVRALSQPDPDGCGVKRTREGSAWLLVRLDALGLVAVGLAFVVGRPARVVAGAVTLGAALVIGFWAFLWLQWGVGCGAWASRFGDHCVWLGALYLPALAALSFATWAVATARGRSVR